MPTFFPIAMKCASRVVPPKLIFELEGRVLLLRQFVAISTPKTQNLGQDTKNPLVAPTPAPANALPLRPSVCEKNYIDKAAETVKTLNGVNLL